MAYLDYKMEVWGRITFPEDKLDEVIDDIKNHRILPSDGIIEGEFEILYDTETYLDKEDNDDQPTIEVHNESGELIYTN